MAAEDSYASESTDVDLETRVARLEQLARLVLEIVPTEWLLSELRDRTHGGEKEEAT